MDYSKLTVSEFIRQSGSLDLRDFYDHLFQRLHQLDRTFDIFVTLAEKQAKSRVRENPKPKGRLAGLPVSLKDNICSEGVQATAGSRILEGYVPPFNATAASRLLSEGAQVVGKTNQDEFGFGWASVNSGYRIPKNPHDPARVCGGSSGGAGALTASLDFPHIALGQSTGGSISSPASFCGVAGLTPTYGLVSRYGLIDFGNSLDKIGPMARRVEDVALMFSAIAGHDPRDPTTMEGQGQDYRKNLKPELEGLKIGVPSEYLSKGLDPKVACSFWDAIKRMEEEGAEYREISLPMTDSGIAVYYIIATSEASTNLAKYCGMRYGAEEDIRGTFNEYFSGVRSKYLGEEAKRRILLGTFSRMAGFRDAYYLKALQARTLLIREFSQAFRDVDVIASPSTSVIAPRFSEVSSMTALQHYMMDVLSVCPNLAGLPHISVPCGKVRGMPVGLQIIGDHLQEQKVLNSAYGYQEVRE